MTDPYRSADWLEKETKAQCHQDRYKAVAEACEGSVLDLGAGLAQLYPHLLALNKKDGYQAVDAEADFVKRMKELGIEAFETDISYNIDPTDTDEPDTPAWKSADTVVLAEILEHLENPGIALANAFRYAKKKVVITLPNDVRDPPYHKWLCRWRTSSGGHLILEFIKDEGAWK